MFGAEFQLAQDIRDTVVFLYLVLPVGFDGTPGICGRLMEGVRHYHRLFCPGNSLWGDCTPLYADVFVDGGMFIEAPIGSRMNLPTDVWRTGTYLVLGNGSISNNALHSEGTCGISTRTSGYYVGIGEDDISISEPKILGDINLTHSPEFNHGCLTSTIHSVRELRGASPAGLRQVEFGDGALNRPIA